MGLATFAELTAAVADWINRDDLGSRLGSFVALCESKINRTLRVGQMEREAVLSPISEQSIFNLPGDFLELRNVRMSGAGGRVLGVMSLESVPVTRRAVPVGYAIVGNRLKLLPQGTDLGTATIDISYYGALPSLEISGTNWLLSRHPDVYLYGTLLEAQGYILNADKLSLWRSLYEEALDAVADEDRHARWSGASLAPDPFAVAR